MRIHFMSLAFIGLLSSSAIAQPSFFGTGTNSDQSTSAQSSSNPRILSAEDFKNSVKSMGQRNQNVLTQQLNDQLSKLPKVPPPGTTAPNTGTTPSSTTKFSPPPATPPSSSFSSMPTQQSTAPTQSYSGFGASTDNSGMSAGTSNTTPAKPASGNTGGWNVNY